MRCTRLAANTGRKYRHLVRQHFALSMSLKVCILARNQQILTLPNTVLSSVYLLSANVLVLAVKQRVVTYSL